MAEEEDEDAFGEELTQELLKQQTEDDGHHGGPIDIAPNTNGDSSTNAEPHTDERISASTERTIRADSPLDTIHTSLPAKSTRKRKAKSDKNDAKPSKCQKRTPRDCREEHWNFKKNKLNFLPEDVEQIISCLRTCCTPFEQSISVVVRNARNRVARDGGEERGGVIQALLRQEEAWKRSNREHVKEMAKLLSRQGVIPIGSVEVPTGSLRVSLPPVGLMKMEDDPDGMMIKKEEIW